MSPSRFRRNALISGSRISANRRMSFSCSLPRARSCAFWSSFRMASMFVGDPRQERGVVPALLGVDVAHVLKAEVVGDLAGRQEGVAGRSRPSGRPGRRRRSCGAAPGPRWLAQGSIVFLGPVSVDDDPSAPACHLDQDRLLRGEGEAVYRRLHLLGHLGGEVLHRLAQPSAEVDQHRQPCQTPHS